jgi:predicted DNA-binding transcriptional regulator AlpA
MHHSQEQLMPTPINNLVSLNPYGFTRVKTAFSLFGFSPSTGYRRIKAGTFPKPVKISSGISANRNSELMEFAVDPANYKAGGQ